MQTTFLIYILLTLVAWVLMFVRAKRKRALIKLAGSYFEGTPYREQWVVASGGIWRLLGDLPSLNLMKQHRKTLPVSVADAYRNYISVSRATYGSILLLLGFALTAHWIWGVPSPN